MTSCWGFFRGGGLLPAHKRLFLLSQCYEMGADPLVAIQGTVVFITSDGC